MSPTPSLEILLANRAEQVRTHQNALQTARQAQETLDRARALASIARAAEENLQIRIHDALSWLSFPHDAQVLERCFQLRVQIQYVGSSNQECIAAHLGPSIYDRLHQICLKSFLQLQEAKIQIAGIHLRRNLQRNLQEPLPAFQIRTEEAARRLQDEWDSVPDLRTETLARLLKISPFHPTPS